MNHQVAVEDPECHPIVKRHEPAVVAMVYNHRPCRVAGDLDWTRLWTASPKCSA